MGDGARVAERSRVEEEKQEEQETGISEAQTLLCCFVDVPRKGKCK